MGIILKEASASFNLRNISLIFVWRQDVVSIIWLNMLSKCGLNYMYKKETLTGDRGVGQRFGDWVGNILRVLHLVNNCFESSGVVEGKVSKNFAVDFDTSFVDKTHKF